MHWIKWKDIKVGEIFEGYIEFKTVIQSTVHSLNIFHILFNLHNINLAFVYCFEAKVS